MTKNKMCKVIQLIQEITNYKLEYQYKQSVGNNCAFDQLQKFNLSMQKTEYIQLYTLLKDLLDLLLYSNQKDSEDTLRYLLDYDECNNIEEYIIMKNNLFEQLKLELKKGEYKK